jgi:hypothetical protein
MTDFEKMDTVENNLIGLGLARAVYVEVYRYFEKTDSYGDLPRYAPQIEQLLSALDVFLLDAIEDLERVVRA